MHVLEVCVDNYESAVTSAKSGANRLELCQDLSVGGLTPTAGFVSVIKKLVPIPVYVLIRPRPGNFRYTTHEVEQMLEDIKITRQMGADGLVFGALNRDNNVDSDVCQKLLAVSSGLPVTFHRAFDQIGDKAQALEDVIQLGFKRILTSGGSEAATDGIETLRDLVLQANGRIIIMPGGDVSNNNILDILQMTKAVEFHSSGRASDPNSPTKKSNVCSALIIEKMREVLDGKEC